MLATGVVMPVVVEAAVRDHCTELEDGFGTSKSPPGTGNVQAIGDHYLNQCDARSGVRQEVWTGRRGDGVRGDVVEAGHSEVGGPVC
ncbi:hypothetical protein J7E87_05940 [Streptomyces sp. ISL-1]|nr:hypothetical protein [Streptomyces sp. ISL-1]